MLKSNYCYFNFNSFPFVVQLSTFNVTDFPVTKVSNGLITELDNVVIGPI